MRIPPTVLRLARETGQLVTGNVGALAIGLVSTVLITRALGEEARGIYAWVFTLQGLAAQVATVVTYHAARQLAARHGVAEWPVLLGTMVALACVGTLLATPLMAYGLLESTLGQHTQSLQLVAYLVVPAAALAAGASALLHTRGGWAPNMASIMAQRVLLLGGTVGLIGVGALTVNAVVWVNALAILGATALTVWLLRLPLSGWRVSQRLAQELAGFLGATWLAMLAVFALPKMAILALGSSGQLAATGHYSVASTLMETALIIPGLAGAVLITHFTRTQSGPAGRRQATLALVGAMLAVAIGGVVVAPWIIPLMFGKAFASAVVPFQMLMAAVVLAGMHQAWQSRLVAAHQRVAVVVPPVVGCAVAAVASWAWVGPWGAMGAACATVVGYAVMAGLTYSLKGTS